MQRIRARQQWISVGNRIRYQQIVKIKVGDNVDLTVFAVRRTFVECQFDFVSFHSLFFFLVSVVLALLCYFVKPPIIRQIYAIRLLLLLYVRRMAWRCGKTQPVVQRSSLVTAAAAAAVQRILLLYLYIYHVQLCTHTRKRNKLDCTTLCRLLLTAFMPTFVHIQTPTNVYMPQSESVLFFCIYFAVRNVCAQRICILSS